MSFIDKISSSNDPREIFNLFLEEIKKFGFDYAMYSEVSSDIKNDWEKNPCIETNYPMEWLEHYVKQGYIQKDPVRRYGRLIRKPFLWKDLYKFELTEEQKDVLSEAAKFGLHNGLVVTLPDLGVDRGIGIATSVKSLETEKHLSVIAKIGLQFDMAYQRSLNKPVEFLAKHIPTIRLTSREHDILQWCAEGKSNWEIGQIISITEDGVRFHFRNIFSKLGVNSRMRAVVKAISLGLISPDVFK